MIVRCPHCRETNAYTDEKRGQNVHCRACQKVFFVSYEGVAGKNKDDITITAEQEPKASLLALASFVLSILLLIMLAPWFIPVEVASAEADFIFSVGPFLALITFGLGIAALIQRGYTRRSLWWLAIIGIAIPVGWVVFLSIWVMGVAGSWH